MSSVWRIVLARPGLLLLLGIDGLFVALHLWLWAHGKLAPQFNVEVDGSVPEMFNYLKWSLCFLSCAFAFFKRRELLNLLWALLFFYFLLDDSEWIHERVGAWITSRMDWGPALGLRGQDFGELSVSAAAGIVLFGLLGDAYWRATDARAKAFSRRLLPWLAVLIFFGIGVDMLHIILAPMVSELWGVLLGVIEDAGEMIMASFLTVICLREALGRPPLFAVAKSSA